MKKTTVLVFAFLCILTLASCSNRKTSAWAWAQKLEHEDILSVVPWHQDEEYITLTPLNNAEILELVRLLNNLPKNSFTENKNLAGITPTYGIQITTAAGIYRINEANAPNGTLEIICDETQWWIDSPELTTFVQTVTNNLPAA